MQENNRVPEEDRDYGRLKAYRDRKGVIYWVREGQELHVNLPTELPKKWWIVRYWDDDDSYTTIGRFMEECDSYEQACARVNRMDQSRSYLIIGPDRQASYEGRIMR